MARRKRIQLEIAKQYDIPKGSVNSEAKTFTIEHVDYKENLDTFRLVEYGKNDGVLWIYNIRETSKKGLQNIIDSDYNLLVNFDAPKEGTL